MPDSHDVIVIGAGAGGLTAAGGCAMFGLKVALVERGAMGGDCLNTGCVPSKALLAAAARAQEVRTAGRFGIRTSAPAIDFAAVRSHVRAAIAAIAPKDSRERFAALGVEVLAGEARFAGDRVVEVNGRRLSAPRVVIATGSRPAVPDLPGLAEVPVLTNETIFALDERPRRLAILGGGPVGVEMAQAFGRLGSEVVLIERGRCLKRSDAEAAALVVARLREEGVEVREGATVMRVERDGDAIRLRMADGDSMIATHLLAASGRRVDLDGLGLDVAGVRHGPDGIIVDGRRRTSAKGVFAVGDCRAGPRFTHASGRDGAAVALAIALGVPAKVDDAALPAVVYTDPELAQVGLTEEQARRRHGGVTIVREPFGEDDRAVTEGDVTGFVKTVSAGRRLVGVTIVGRGAGDLLLPWSLVLGGKASRFALAQTVVAYSTRSERSKEAAFKAYQPLLFGRAARGWARLLARWRRRA